MGVYRKHNWQRKMKKTTVKEIKRWLKSLEEFRYRKVRGVDARRIASFVNNSYFEHEGFKRWPSPAKSEPLVVK